MSFEMSLFFITLPFLMILGAFIVDKNSKSDSHETGGDHKKLSSDIKSLRKEIKQLSDSLCEQTKELSEFKSKWSTWTPITCCFTDISASSPGTTSVIDLNSVNVPDTATQVLVYAHVNSGWISESSLGAQIEIYSDPKHSLSLFVFGYKQSAVSYNSENIWLPIGEKRKVCGKYVGKAISTSIGIQFKIIGYR